jgi:hypothetical protein
MRAPCVLGGLLLVLSAPLSAERLDGPPPGLVALASPPLDGEGPPGCVRPDTRRQYTLRAGPGNAHARIGSLQFRAWGDDAGECNEALPRFTAAGHDVDQPVPTLERGYEEPALPVLAMEKDWLRVSLGEGSGWIRRPGDFVVEDYPALLADKLAYATEAWSGELCDAAGTGCRQLEADEQRTVRVLATRVVDGTAWIEVELTTDPCRDGVDRRLDQGWIRSRDAEGRPTVWFHSRGC